MSTRVRVALVGGASLVVVLALLAFAAWPDASPNADDGSATNEPHHYTVHLRGHADDGTLANTCTGVLVASEWVLTVKHCWGGADSFTAIVGIADWTVAETDPDAFVYESSTIERQGVGVDLAMIRLDRPVRSDVGVPIPLSAERALPEGMSVTIAGWGEREGGVRPVVLDAFTTTIDADCGDWGEPETFTDFLEAGFDHDTTICTSAIPQGACTGDSGAPVVFDEAGVSLLVGIVAFGSGEGCSVDPLLPDGHVAVASFADWVASLSGGP